MRRIFFAALVLGASPALAQDLDSASQDTIGGLRIEGHAGIERPNLNFDDGITTYVDELGSSFTYGAEIGYDIPVSSTVTVGPYISFDTGGSDECETYSAGPNLAGTSCFHSNSNLSMGARVAYNVSAKTELYLTLGYDLYDVDYSDRVVNTSTSVVVANYARNGVRDSSSIGIGANFDLSNNLYAGIGMRSTSTCKSEAYGINMERFQAHVTIGFRM